MSHAPWVVHPHWHRRRTGVTTHVEAMLRALKPEWGAHAWGLALDADLTRVTLADVAAQARQHAVVWHAHRNNELLLGLLLRALRPRVKVVFTRHGGNAPGAWTRFLMRRVDRLVTLTPEMAQGVPHVSTVVPHGIDLSRFHRSKDRARSWSELGLGGLYGVGVVGRIRPDKGQADFARAWALARSADWRAVLVGAARPRHARFLSEVQALGGRDFVSVGQQADVARWFQGLTVLVQPSRVESYSLVLLEAMASGCCVVAAKQPHYSRWIRHGENGFLYEPGDVAALAGHLRQLFADPTLAEEMGARAAAWAHESLGVEHEVRALSAVYSALVEG